MAETGAEAGDAAADRGTSTAETASKKRRKSMAERLESGDRIISLIDKAEIKRVAKKKIIHFLKKKGVSEQKIIEAYQKYYEREVCYCL